MSNDKGFRKMNELVDALRDAEAGMHKGSIGIEGIDRACDDARELYERLLVLRHKAREAMVAKTASTEAPAPAPKAQEVQRPAAPAAAAPVRPTPPAPVAKPAPVAAEPAPIKLDTRPQEVKEPAVAVVEAVVATATKTADGPVAKTAAEFLKEAEAARATVKVPSVTEKPAVEKSVAGKTVAEKMEKTRVDDLSKAISVSHRFWFTAELFNGERAAYEKALAQLNKANDLDEATALLQKSIVPNPRKPVDPDARATFLDLLQRRFI